MLLSISNFDKQLTEELIRYYTHHGKVDGVILVDSNAAYSQDVKTAIVAITAIGHTDISVRIEYSMRTALRTAVEQLHSLGHRRIAYVGEALTEKKKKMLTEELCRLGIDPDSGLLYSSRMRFEAAGRDGVEVLFSDGKERPTAILGAYGYITQGIIAALTERGYSIPKDVSVISMDSDPSPLHAVLDVTRIDTDIESACNEAIKLIKSRIGSSEPNSPFTVEHNAVFCKGETVLRIKNG